MPTLHIIDNTKIASAVCIYPAAETQTQRYRLETAIKENEAGTEAAMERLWSSIQKIKAAHKVQQCNPITNHWTLDPVKAPSTRRTPSAESFIRALGQFNETAGVIRDLASLATAEEPREWYEELTNIIIMSASGGTAVVLALGVSCICYLHSVVKKCMRADERRAEITSNSIRPFGGYAPARPSLPRNWLPMLEQQLR